MKITKIKTTLGQFGSPITSDLSDIVERMRSPKTKEVADRIAAIALQSRLAMQQGAPRYMLNDANRLPYLMFSATFGSRSLNKPAALTRLLMLNIPCPQGTQQISELRRRVSQSDDYRRLSAEYGIYRLAFGPRRGLFWLTFAANALSYGLGLVLMPLLS